MISKIILLRKRRAEGHAKLAMMRLDLLAQLGALPRGFCCYQVRKDARGDLVLVHASIAAANARGDDDFQYVMHELDDWMLRRMA